MSAGSGLRERIDAIAIGASAGGVEALSVLLPALGKDLRASVFVVLHLPRHRPSRLASIFQARCALPVLEAEDKAPVAPGTVYLAPPDYHLLLDRGPCLALSTDEPVNYSRPAIDVLFESAAELYRERLLGMVLTGGNQDGTAGLQAVHRHGGTTVIQSPESAHMTLMPASALQRLTPDHVLPLPGIADLLRGLEGRA
jgi:two-component system chemotaxis response regulator CheB